MLSQTSEYALRAMVCLASRDGGLTATPELADAANVPHSYLAKVLQMLASADLIAGRRGVGGGYRLCREPAQIKLLDIVDAVDPSKWLRVSAPVDDPALEALQRTLDRAIHSVVRVLGQTTLAGIINQGENQGAVVHHLAS